MSSEYNEWIPNSSSLYSDICKLWTVPFFRSLLLRQTDARWPILEHRKHFADLNLQEWPEWLLPPHLKHCSWLVFLLSCAVNWFTWGLSLMVGWNACVFLSAISIALAILQAFSNVRSSVFNSLFWIFGLFRPQTNRSRNALIKCTSFWEMPNSFWGIPFTSYT